MPLKKRTLNPRIAAVAEDERIAIEQKAERIAIEEENARLAAVAEAERITRESVWRELKIKNILYIS